jgi:hypothetical protein
MQWEDNPLKAPPPAAVQFPAVPANWERTADIRANKPSTQYYTKLFSAAVWGDAADHPGQTGFSIEQYPIPADSSPTPPYGIGTAPYSYWHRSQNSYAQMMGIVDDRIGEVLAALEALPQAVIDNTVVVFTSDHGEYAGAHGYLSGKVGSAYDEAYHVPLIVSDPSGRFTQQPSQPRTGLTSSVDLLRMLVTIGNGGGTDWMNGPLGEIYGGRHDLSAMLKSPEAPGRPYVLLATDEVVPGYFNFNQSPAHILAMRTPDVKLGIYANWAGVTDQIVDDTTLETEFYDYATPEGRLETANLKHDPRIPPMKTELLGTLVPTELRAPLPGPLRDVQAAARAQYLAYDALIRNKAADGFSQGQLTSELGYGADF